MIKFDTADVQDAAKIAEIRLQCWMETYRGIYSDCLIDDFDHEFHRMKIVENIKDDSIDFYNIESKDKMIGYFSFGIPMYKIFQCSDLQLYSLYVLREYQQRGIGTKVIHKLVEICKENQFCSICLTCNSHNIQAKTFYKCLGFEQISEKNGHERQEEDQSFFCL